MKVSIIIPIYNTFEYLPKCIESVLNQTYSDFELLLIDDGSSDGSSVCCDEYAKKDVRIRVFHKRNAGQGIARNLGMEMAKGNYLAFLDSDDYWDWDYLQSLIELLENNNADIAVCGYRFVNHNYQFLRNASKDKIGTIKIFSGLEASQSILYWNDFGVAPWAKLFRKEVWKDIKFCDGVISEDLATTYKVYLNAKKVVYDNTPKMSYYLRRDSAIHMSFNKNKLISIDITEKIITYCTQNYPELLKAAECRMVATCFFIMFQIPKKSKEYKENIKQCKSNIKKYRFRVMLDSKARRKTRLASFISFFGFKLTHKVYQFMKKKNQLF